MTLFVKRSDLLRATLADDCGNVGFLGVSADRTAYHVVAPVDHQIARGIKAGNRPADGTPFGGYTGWDYFECGPYDGQKGDREGRADVNARLLEAWAAQLGFKLAVEG